jgi:hypothetical protein
MHGLDRSIALVQRLLLDPGAIALDPAPEISAVA